MMWTYVVFACFLTVENLWTLDDAFRRNMLVTLLRRYNLLATIGRRILGNILNAKPWDSQVARSSEL